MYAQRCQAARTPADRRFQPLMGIRDHQRDSLKLRRAKLFRKLDQKVSASDGPMCSQRSRVCHRVDCTAIIAAPRRCGRPRLLQVVASSTDTATRGERPVEERVHALVDLLAQLGNLRLADPDSPIAAPDRRPPVDTPPSRPPGYRDQRLLELLRASRNGGKYALRNFGCAAAASRGGCRACVAVAVAQVLARRCAHNALGQSFGIVLSSCNPWRNRAARLSGCLAA